MMRWRLLGWGLIGLVACASVGATVVTLQMTQAAGAVVASKGSSAVGAPRLDPDELRTEQLLARQAAAADRAQWDLSQYPGAAPAIRPIDPLMPDPGPTPARWAPLDQAVQEVATSFPGRLSVVAVDLESGARYDFRPHDRYLPASTFKLPVVLCTVQAIERGELTWETLVTFTPEDNDTVGQGGFAEAPYGGQYPIRNLLNRSIISSNNVAVKMLARTLTFDGLSRCSAQMGGQVTRTEEGSTPVTAADEAAWWLTLWRMKQEKPALAEDLLGPLRQVPYRGRIQAGTPVPDLVTHKFGTYPPYENDGAIIWTEHPYILVVLTYGGDHLGVDPLFEQLARAAWPTGQG